MVSTGATGDLLLYNPIFAVQIPFASQANRCHIACYFPNGLCYFQPGILALLPFCQKQESATRRLIKKTTVLLVSKPFIITACLLASALLQNTTSTSVLPTMPLPPIHIACQKRLASRQAKVKSADILSSFYQGLLEPMPVE